MGWDQKVDLSKEPALAPLVKFFESHGGSFTLGQEHGFNFLYEGQCPSVAIRVTKERGQWFLSIEHPQTGQLVWLEKWLSHAGRFVAPDRCLEIGELTTNFLWLMHEYPWRSVPMDVLAKL